MIMSAGPAARIIGDFAIDLARPRDVAEIRIDAGFMRLHQEIWQTMKEEVLKALGHLPGVTVVRLTANHRATPALVAASTVPLSVANGLPARCSDASWGMDSRLMTESLVMFRTVGRATTTYSTEFSVLSTSCGSAS